MEIPWNHQARLLRTTGAGEESVATGVLEQLVAGFLEHPPEQQNALVLRASGPDWACEWNAEEIRELAARPEFTGAFGRWDSARDPDSADGVEAADDYNLVEAGVSGPSGAGDGRVDAGPSKDDQHTGR